ncbi:MAG: hypothetical protein C4560_00400 [Nitrospiraceae bacterium]|nr:MAG: hypothetical protein C4560_00400 [Nitrospiraceae bacterium]
MKKGLYITLMMMALVVLMFEPERAGAAVLLDRVVATVNDEVITWSELRSIVALDGKGFLEKVPESDKEAAVKGLERNFLNTLIDMRLQLQEARKKGLNVSDSEIEGAIADIKKKFDLSDDALMNSLEAEGMTPEDYRARLGEQILLSKVVHFEVKANIAVADREIEEYFNANKDRFGREKLRLRQIFFAAPRNDFQKKDIEARANEIILRIKNGEDFSKLAGEFSEDSSRQFGGDLGYISRGVAMREVEHAAFSLKTGEVSAPFWSPAGLHIIKLEDRVEGEVLDKVKDRIKEVLFERAFESKYLDWKAGLKEKAYIEIKL